MEFEEDEQTNNSAANSSQRSDLLSNFKRDNFLGSRSLIRGKDNATKPTNIPLGRMVVNTGKRDQSYQADHTIEEESKESSMEMEFERSGEDPPSFVHQRQDQTQEDYHTSISMEMSMDKTGFSKVHPFGDEAISSLKSRLRSILNSDKRLEDKNSRSFKAIQSKAR